MRNVLKNKWVLGFLIVGGSVFALWMKTEPPKRKCCEGLDTGVCLCELTGVCLCEPGGRSCGACKHKQRPEVEAALKQAKLLEQAKRSTTSTVPK